MSAKMPKGIDSISILTDEERKVLQEGIRVGIKDKPDSVLKLPRSRLKKSTIDVFAICLYFGSTHSARIASQVGTRSLAFPRFICVSAMASIFVVLGRLS